jgi:hypothetical protein
VAPIGFRRDHGGASARRQIVADRVGVERLVGNHGDAFNRAWQRLGQDAVVALAGGQNDAHDLLRRCAHRRADLGWQPAA